MNKLKTIGVILLALWGVTFLPSVIKSEAESSFRNMVGKDVGIDINKFHGPLKMGYRSYRWYMPIADHDSLFIDVKIVPYFTGNNQISYGSSSGSKTLDDFPNRQE